MKMFFTGLMILAFQAGFGQSENFVTSGVVVDAADKKPMSGTSVFCQNTTIGTITNNEGSFSIRLPKGGYDLIVSYTGYETQTLHINSTNATNLTIALAAKDKSLSEVTVSGSNEVADGLAKYGQFFRDNFIGTTPNAALCIIQNPEALQFFYSKLRNRLKIKQKEDIVIINQALGYKIRYQLDSFSYEYNKDISTYSGYPFFEELDSTAGQKEVWKKNRLKAYKGSRLHFVRSWYDSTLEDEGFVVEVVDPTKKVITATPIENPYDSAHYTVGDNEEVEITWPGKLRVFYKNELPDKKFLSQYKLSPALKSQVTILDIAAAFVIEQNGYFYDQTDIVNTGYWSWEKVAEALPYDYNPE